MPKYWELSYPTRKIYYISPESASTNKHLPIGIARKMSKGKLYMWIIKLVKLAWSIPPIKFIGKKLYNKGKKKSTISKKGWPKLICPKAKLHS